MTALRDFGDRELNGLLAQVTAAGIAYFELRTPDISFRVGGRGQPQPAAVPAAPSQEAPVRAPSVGVLHWGEDFDGVGVHDVRVGTVIGEVDVAGTRIRIVAEADGIVTSAAADGAFVEYASVVATISAPR